MHKAKEDTTRSVMHYWEYYDCDTIAMHTPPRPEASQKARGPRKINEVGPGRAKILEDAPVVVGVGGGGGHALGPVATAEEHVGGTRDRGPIPVGGADAAGEADVSCAKVAYS